MLFIVYILVDVAKRTQLPLPRAVAIALQFLYDSFESKDPDPDYSTLTDYMCVNSPQYIRNQNGGFYHC